MKPASGRLLIAEPFMGDPYFKGAVVMLCEHKPEGTFGLILNKPSEMKVNDVVENFPSVDNFIYYGGPVQPNTLHYLHRRSDLIPESSDLGNGIFWGGDFEKLIFMLDTKQISEDEIKFFYGYSGWEEGQLENEISTTSWFIGNSSQQYLFQEDPKTLWRTVLKDMGDRFRVIANFPENPNLN
ncbi:MAG: YqgE/AlgH family protein [Chitinophagales bacterium]|nr:YqgE/AlgH family protein [Chitinophagales bacterium]